MARNLRISADTVRKWRRRFLAERLGGLTDEPRPATHPPHQCRPSRSGRGGAGRRRVSWQCSLSGLDEGSVTFRRGAARNRQKTSNGCGSFEGKGAFGLGHGYEASA
ncbi:helix-turn-helix domain-containing protein [Streptomyces sp. NPDC001312]|uniref:helix-turn-helix domain-containing protein n=1 Tax=Streptomyces sp. NPDC001312 TaxID=3364561 RepID=UPI00367B6581